MEKIISYLMGEFIKNLEELRKNLYKDPEKLADFILKTRKETDELGRRFVELVVQEINDSIRDLPARKRNWVVERKGDGKTLTTTLGDIIFYKTLYTSKTEKDEDGKPLSNYLVDKLLGLEPNQTMTEDVVANILREAVLTSYNKAGKNASPNGVTKSTVKGLLHTIRFPQNFQPPMVKKQVDYLYIDADEDHYHLQFQNQRGDLVRNERGYKNNGAINKIIYVFEGIEPEAPNSKRNRLINTHYFCRGEDQKNKDIWREVFEYVEACYDLEKVKRIYINADGGNWIKTGYRSVLDATFVLDEFHLSKYILKMTGHMKDSTEDAQRELYDCVRNKGRKEFRELVEKLKGCTFSERDHERITKAAEYILGNWTAARYRLRKKDGVLGCSAEGHVYHVLSSRMSTQAMGWSRRGGSQMAHLREYYYNGGDMLELAKFQKRELPMAAGAESVVFSAGKVLRSEHNDRNKSQIEYGKYADAMGAIMTVHTSKQLSFWLNSRF